MGGSVYNVVGWRMMFCVVVHKIGRTFCPVKAELVLGCPAMEPVEVHPDHLDAALDDGVLNKSSSSCIVGLDGRFWLCPTHFLQCIA